MRELRHHARWAIAALVLAAFAVSGLAVGGPLPITQPGGPGTTIIFDDDATAPGGKGYYDDADFAAAAPADFVARATVPISYEIGVGVQNGDGVSTAKTTWRSTNKRFHWAVGRTYTISAVGRTNRWTEWGSIAESIAQVFGDANGTARTSTFTSTAFDSSEFSGVIAVLQMLGACTGTGATLDGKIQESDDGLAWADLAGATFVQCNELSDNYVAVTMVDFAAAKRYVRYVGTIAGTTPSFAISVGIAAEPVGYDGVVAVFGAATTISGNHRVGGCDLRNYQAGAAGTIFLLPTTAGAKTGDCIDTDVFTQGGTQAYGNSTQPLSRLRRLTAVGLGAGTNGRVVQFNCRDADTPTFNFPNGGAKIDSGGTVIMRNPRFIGASTGGDLRLTFNGGVLNPKWSRRVTKSALQTFEEFVDCEGVITKAGARVAGALVQIYDKNNRKVVDVRTDAAGRPLTFPNAPSILAPAIGIPFIDCLAAIALEAPLGTNVWTYQGPWRVEVNGDGAISGYPKVTRYVDAPYDEYPIGAGFEREYRTIGFTIDLPAPAVTVAAPYFRWNDLPYLISGVGSQPITIGGAEASCYVDVRTREVGRGFAPLLVLERRAYVFTGSLPGLVVGSILSTGGSTYRAANVEQIGDGALTEILLATD